MNILIVKLSAIGDVIHTLPSLAELRRHYPGADISWVVEEAAADLIEGHPHLDRVIVSGRKRWIAEMKRGRLGGPLRELRDFLRELRARPYDLVIDFHGLFKSAALVRLSQGSRKLGYDSFQELSGLFYNEKIPEDLKKHAVDRYLDFPRYLGADVGTPEFLIPVTDDNRNRVEAVMSSEGISEERPFVAVSPGALWETKLWEDGKFARLCDRMVEELGVGVVLTGGGRKELEGIRRRMQRRAVNLGGATTLRELAWLYRLAALLVTTDSGPMHLAAAMGTPVVALFGPTDPARTGPYGEGHIVIRRGIYCSPCFLKHCDSLRCMKEITVGEVFSAVAGRLEERASVKRQHKGEGNDL